MEVIFGGFCTGCPVSSVPVHLACKTSAGPPCGKRSRTKQVQWFCWRRDPSFPMSVVHIICLLLGFVCCWCCLSTHMISLSNILPCSLVKTDAICNSYSVQLDINILWGSLLGHVYVAMYNLYIYIKQSHVLYIQINERMDKNNKIKKKSGSNKTGKLIHFDPNCFCYSGSFCGLSACFTH